VSRASTWGCGYDAPTPRMQYTATSSPRRFSRHSTASTLRAFIATDPQDTFRPAHTSNAAMSTFPLTSCLSLRCAVSFGFSSVARPAAGAHSYVSRIYSGGPHRFAGLGARASDGAGLAMINVLIHIGVLLAFPPLSLGLIRKNKAIVAGRVGPPLLRPISTSPSS